MYLMYIPYMYYMYIPYMYYTYIPNMYITCISHVYYIPYLNALLLNASSGSDNATTYLMAPHVKIDSNEDLTVI
jgi:hypothetical protein